MNDKMTENTRSSEKNVSGTDSSGPDNRDLVYVSTNETTGELEFCAVENPKRLRLEVRTKLKRAPSGIMESPSTFTIYPKLVDFEKGFRLVAPVGGTLEKAIHISIRGNLRSFIASKVEEARIDPFDFVESCEPDCSPVRHAHHQGQWDMAVRISEHFGVDPYPGALQSKEGDS